MSKYGTVPFKSFMKQFLESCKKKRKLSNLAKGLWLVLIKCYSPPKTFMKQLKSASLIKLVSKQLAAIGKCPK